MTKIHLVDTSGKKLSAIALDISSLNEHIHLDL